MVLDSGSGSGILSLRIFEMEVPWDCRDNFQSSFRDFSSLEFLPRTVSWAKFNRPCGTRFRDGRSHAPSSAAEVRFFEASGAKCFFSRLRIRQERSEGRTSGAKALIRLACCGTAEAVPFVERRFPIGDGQGRTEKKSQISPLLEKHFHERSAELQSLRWG
jgi:hypothetical protein